ncbi:MAG: 2-C-methyl-D-erythritol 2,4-cyclodiphosphate synthase [Syntrophorhabdaceae bacterium]|nr:2-C-methyl-D-erythritol 2,4-cyclodiphosphate synthase [Syntrophorhabdaceae bacterium]
MRIGLGFDIHRLVKGRKLVLGGIEIPCEMGLLGHSDGDVLIHAISDAILGAAGAGDIGEHFPDTDTSTEGMDSGKILSYVLKAVKERGYGIKNIDAVVITEEPKILPYRRFIQEKIAKILDIDPEQVSVKGKTSEGIGHIGKKEAIAVYATALLMDV